MKILNTLDQLLCSLYREYTSRKNYVFAQRVCPSYVTTTVLYSCSAENSFVNIKTSFSTNCRFDSRCFNVFSKYNGECCVGAVISKKRKQNIFFFLSFLSSSQFNTHCRLISIFTNIFCFFFNLNVIHNLNKYIQNNIILLLNLKINKKTNNNQTLTFYVLER